MKPSNVVHLPTTEEAEVAKFSVIYMGVPIQSQGD